jgi:hypothetical protein
MNKKFLKLFKIMLLGPLFPILAVPKNEGNQEGEADEGNGENNNSGEDNPDNDNTDNDNTDNDETNKDLKTFTQQDIDKILARKIKQQEKKIRDEYEEKQKKAQMTEIEKANFERDEANKKIEALRKENEENNIRTEVYQVATKLNAVDVEAVYQLLDRENIVVENGKISGVKEAVTSLLNNKKFLVKNIETRAGHEQNNKNIPDSNKAFNDMIRNAFRR